MKNKKEKLNNSFYNLNYKGKNIFEGLDSIVSNETAIAYFSHIYLTAGFSDDAPRRHYCLKSGYWCWRNFFEHPLDIIGYARNKLFKTRKLPAEV